MMKLSRILKNRIFKNAGWIIGGRLVNKLLAFLVSIVTARYLGPGNYGLINYAMAYITFAASLCNLGINSVIIKNFSDHPEEEGIALGTTVILRMVTSFLSAIMIVGVVAVVDKGESVTILVTVLSTIGLLFQSFDIFTKWFQSKLQSKYAAIATVVAYITVSVYKIILLVFRKSVEWFALATALEYLVMAVILLWFYKRNGGKKLGFSAIKAKQLLMASSGFIISGLMVSIYAATDKLMLKQIMDDATVGYYSLAVSLSNTWTFILQAIIDSVHPSVFQCYGKDDVQFEKKNRQLYAIVLYIALTVSLIMNLLANPLVETLYGKAFLPAAKPFRIVSWYIAFSYLGVARNAWIVCENKQKYLKYIYASSALINVLLNYILIPHWGAIGAAWASLCTQILTVVVLPAIIRPLRKNAKMMLQAALLKDVF